MNMFARFDKLPAMTLQDIKEIKCYGRTYALMDNMKTVEPPQTNFAGGITTKLQTYCTQFIILFEDAKILRENRTS